MPFEVKDGMEGEHTPQNDLTRHHHHFEENLVGEFSHENYKMLSGLPRNEFGRNLMDKLGV